MEPGGPAFAWGAWAVLTVSAALMVARFGTNVPVWDDHVLTPVLAGERPMTLGWLWEQCNEHRIAVPKLILVVASRAAGNDVRAGMAVSVVALSALSAGLLALTRRLRGGTLACDAFFPIVLLHPGHAANLLWAIQVACVLPTALGAAFLLPIAGRPQWPGPRDAWLCGLALAMLALCGGSGLPYVPPLALWLMAAGISEARRGRPGRGATVALGAVPGLVLAALYMRGFEPVRHPASLNPAIDAARAALQFLVGGLGPAAADGWPWAGGAVLGLIALSVGLMARAWWFQPEERPRAFGLLMVLASLLGMAAAVGWGRGWAGDRAGFQDRYVTMASPLWCWFVIVGRLYAPAPVGRIVANGLFAVACVLLWPNAEAGVAHGRAGSDSAAALASDVRQGLPPFQIVRKHTPFLHPSQDEAARLLPLLRSARIGPFAVLKDDPMFRQVAVPVKPTSLSLAEWDGPSQTARVTGVDPQLTYALPFPRFVAAIRLRYSHSNAQGAPARFQVTWKGPGQSGYDNDRRYALWALPTGDGMETTVRVAEVIDSFRIQPDNQPCDFRVIEVILMEP